MMGSALRVEAAAHRQGGGATERELSFQVCHLPLRESLMVGRLVGWLVGWLIGWWLGGWVGGWVGGWLVGWLVG